MHTFKIDCKLNTMRFLYETETICERDVKVVQRVVRKVENRLNNYKLSYKLSKNKQMLNL